MNPSGGSLAAGWQIRSVGELATAIQYGHTAKANRAVEGPRYLRITDIQDDEVDWSQVPSCEIDEEDIPKFKLEPGDLVFARTGATVGKSFLIRAGGPSSVFASYLIRVRLGVGIDPRFVAYFFQSPAYWRQISDSSAGIGQPNVNGKKLAQVRLPVGPYEEQVQIVAEIEKQFSRLDEAVTNLQRVKANLKRFTSSVLAEAVGGRLVATEADMARDDDRAFERAAEALGRRLAARHAQVGRRGRRHEPIPATGELAELPEGWCWSTVDQLADVGTGATPNRSKAVYFEGGNVPWVTSSVVNTPYVDQAGEFVTAAALEQTNLTLYPPGTLLVAMYGEGKTRGKCSELRIGAATNQALAALQVDAEVRPYLKLFLEHNYEATRKAASGGVQPNLNLGLVRAIKVPLPPIVEQHRIVAEVDRRLSIVREVEAEVDANLKRAQALRQSILSAAFAMRGPRETMAAL